MLHAVRRLLGHWPVAVASGTWAALLEIAIRRVSQIRTIEFAEARFLWLALVIPAIYAVAWRTLASVPPWQRAVMGTTRSLLLLCLTVVLAQPKLRIESRSRCTVLLGDVSPSVPDEALAMMELWASRFERAVQPGDVVWRVAFDDRARVIHQRFVDARDLHRQTAASDYGAALDFAAGQCGVAETRHVVLFGDGLDTRAGMAAAAERLRAHGYALDVVPSRVPPPADVAVRRIRLPGEVQLGRPLRIGVDLYATRSVEAELAFELDGAPNPREPSRVVTLEPGDRHLEFESQINRAGTANFRVRLTARGPDAIAENNQATASIEVKGPPSVLLVTGHRDRASAFESALTAQRFAVRVIGPESFPTDLNGLVEPSFVVLSDLKRDQLVPEADALIERYLRDQGGGLLFAGGSTSAPAGGWSGSALERLLPVTLSIPEQRQSVDVALVLTIDRSGSMSGLPLEMAKAACAATIETLRTSDLVEVIAFDAKPVRFVEMQRARARVAMANDLSRMVSGGDTEMFPALDMAYQDLLAVEARKKHVILLTDGQSPKAGLSEIVQNMVAESITLTIVGLGPDVDTDLLRHLAGRGGGRYHAAPDPNSLPRIFTREAESLVKPPESNGTFGVLVQKPAEFLRGIDMTQAPPLGGYARSQKKPGAAEVILESDRGEPILARQRVGAGWSLAWTSDLAGAWARDWVRWGEYARFFAQLLRSHQGHRTDKVLPMQLELEGDHLTVSVDAVTQGGGFDSDRAIRLEVQGSDAEASTNLAMDLVGPGLYRAEYRLPKLGDYRLKATQRRFDAQGNLQPLGESRGQVTLSYPVEFERLEPDHSALRQLAANAGGQFDPQPEDVHRRPRGVRVSYRPWQVPWLLGALGLFVVDVFFKRWRVRR